MKKVSHLPSVQYLMHENIAYKITSNKLAGSKHSIALCTIVYLYINLLLKGINVSPHYAIIIV